LVDGTVVFRKRRNNKSFVSVEPVVEVDVAVAEAPVKKAPKTEAAPKVEEKVEAKTEVKVEEPKAEVKKEAPKAETGGDDLTKLTGVGPKLAEILNAAGLNTYADVAGTSLEKFKEILEAAGSRYASKDPQPWIDQAKELA
jgi:large subunit ribosomal protein L27